MNNESIADAQRSRDGWLNTAKSLSLKIEAMKAAMELAVTCIETAQTHSCPLCKDYLIEAAQALHFPHQGSCADCGVDKENCKERRRPDEWPCQAWLPKPKPEQTPRPTTRAGTD